MASIHTLFYKFLQSLLNFFTFGYLRRRRAVKSFDDDIEEGLSVDDKDPLQEYDAAIEVPVIIPTTDAYDEFEFVEVSLSNSSIQDVISVLPDTPAPHGELTSYEASFPEATVVSTPRKRLARAKLLDILIQFPLPPSHKSDSESPKEAPPAQDPVAPSVSVWGPNILWLSTKIWNRDRGEDADPPKSSPTIMMHSNSKRSSLVWFADRESNQQNDDESSGDVHWVSIQRLATTTVDKNEEFNPDNTLSWISESESDRRNDMATVLKEFQEVDMHDENFRDLFANMSISTEGYSSMISSDSLAGCGDDHQAQAANVVLRWSVQSFGETIKGEKLEKIHADCS